MTSTTVELLAAVFGLIGTLLLATNGRWSGWGFVAFLASNAGWLTFAFHQAHWFMFWQQVGFTVSSLIGIWVWLIRPNGAQPHPKSSQRAFEGQGNISASPRAFSAPRAPFLGSLHYIPDPFNMAGQKPKQGGGA